MLPTPDQLLAYIYDRTYRPQKRRDLARGLRVSDTDYAGFRGLIDDLAREGRIVRIKGNRYDAPERQNLVVGRLTVSGGSKGFGFVVPEGDGKDVYIDASNLGTALHGDKVLVKLYSKGKKTRQRTDSAPERRPAFQGLPEGRVVRILERRIASVVGTYRKEKRFGSVEPDDLRIPRNIFIEAGKEGDAEPGQKVVARVEHWGMERLNPKGVVVEVLGDADAPGVDILAIVRSYDLPTGFPDDVLREAEAIPLNIASEEIARRKDLRDQVCITIDPQDAKDYDDAVSLESLGNGHSLLGVHIADVSYYVPENSAIDQEAFVRGTSVYLVDRVIPMLPPQLSNEICTLKPDVDRLAVSVLAELDHEGKVVRYDMAETIIRSRARLTYEQVQRILDGTIDSEYQHLVPLREHLLAMRGLSEILNQKRIRRGAIDFDLPEVKVVLDEQTGVPTDLYPEKRLQSHRIIEEFMLLANEVVAGHMHHLDVPFLYRVHDKPDREKAKAFWTFVKTLGYAFRTKGGLRPDTVQHFLKEMQGKPEEYLINDLLVRSMKRALYTPDNIGHFGLAVPFYTHFTSPIRRYPDLVVHRLLKACTNGPMNEARQSYLSEWLPTLGEVASERERIADEAERESVKVKQVQFMEAHLGDSYWGIICGVHPFGFFVQLDRLLIDGLVHITVLEDDYYHFDQAQYALIGERWQRTFGVGDRVYVQVVRADKASRQVDFVLLEHEERGGKKRSRNARRVKQRR